MPVRNVQEVLTPHSLTSPDLEILRPTERRYTCLLLQPSGPIFANGSRIGSLNPEAAALKARKFLELAQVRGVHLAITPEYFFPWDTLRSVIADGIEPTDDALWVLGCESIQVDQLDAFKQAVVHDCLVIHESFDTLPANGVLLDPVVFLFHARDDNGVNQLVALIQFKTYPSRDDLFLEEAVLKRGSIIYRFRGASGHLSVATIICSDAFTLSGGGIAELIDRSTLIHIQLNPNPRHTAYRAYRARTFQTDPRASGCHIICLNWAQSIVQHGDAGQPSAWANIAGSTWYCPHDACSPDDQIVLPNHQKGLYYTCLCNERRHALLFHYDEAVFELLVPKLLTVGDAVMANRNGPSATRRYTWNGNNQDWAEAPNPPESGFSGLLAANADANTALQHVRATVDVLGIERVLALTAGTINGLDDWFAANEVDSLQMEADEIVHRITVAQDMNQKAQDFRHFRLARIAHLHHEIATTHQWPPQVAGMNNQARIQWSIGNPSFNVMTQDGRPTLVVHLGESPPPRHLESAADMLYELLRRVGGPAQKRLCIIYRQYGTQKFAAIPGLTRFDDALENATDILVVQPTNVAGEGLDA